MYPVPLLPPQNCAPTYMVCFNARRYRCVFVVRSSIKREEVAAVL